MLTHVQREDFSFLNVHDQLRRERHAGHVFHGFKEAPITFPPTYRMLKGQPGYSNKKNQNPSYTDRVQWLSAPGCVRRVEVDTYTSAPGLMIVRDWEGLVGIHARAHTPTRRATTAPCWPCSTWRRRCRTSTSTTPTRARWRAGGESRCGA